MHSEYDVGWLWFSDDVGGSTSDNIYFSVNTACIWLCRIISDLGIILIAYAWFWFCCLCKWVSVSCCEDASMTSCPSLVSLVLSSAYTTVPNRPSPSTGPYRKSDGQYSYSRSEDGSVVIYIVFGWWEYWGALMGMGPGHFSGGTQLWRDNNLQPTSTETSSTASLLLLPWTTLTHF